MTFTRQMVKETPLWVLNCSVIFNSLQPHGLQHIRFLCPWDSPDKNKGVGCHFLLQGIFLIQGSKLCLLHWQADYEFIWSLSQVYVPMSAYASCRCPMCVSYFRWNKIGWGLTCPSCISPGALWALPQLYKQPSHSGDHCALEIKTLDQSNKSEERGIKGIKRKHFTGISEKAREIIETTSKEGQRI